MNASASREQISARAVMLLFLDLALGSGVGITKAICHDPLILVILSPMLRDCLPVLFACAVLPAAWAQPKIGAIVNFGSYQANLAPGSLASIFGSGLGPAQGMQFSTDGTLPGLKVTVNGVSAFLLFDSASQVNIQIPVEIKPGTATLVLTYQGVASQQFTFIVLPYAPAFPSAGANGTGTGLFLHGSSTRTIVSAAAPAQPGETISAFLYGLGATIPPVPSGITPTGTLYQVAVEPQITVGGVPAQVVFAGMAPNQVGVAQINFIVPILQTAAGFYPVEVTQGNISTNPVLIQIGTIGITLDRTGILFDAVQTGPSPPPTTINAYNGTSKNTTTINASASTTDGANWLSVSPASASVFLAPGAFRVAVNPASLAPGSYYGLISFTSTDAINSPQVATIVLRVATPNTPPPPTVTPVGLTLLGLAGSPTPVSQNIAISYVGLGSQTITSSVTSSTNPNPFSVSSLPASIGSGQTLNAAIQANAAGLVAGIYRGTLTLNFPQLGASRSVDLQFIVIGQSQTQTRPASQIPQNARAATSCNPTRLVPVFEDLSGGGGFAALVAWPAAIVLKVVDDCGAPMDNGNVEVSFSTGDAPISLNGDGAGHWTGTWAPLYKTANVAVTAKAYRPDLGIEGQVQLTGSVIDNAGVPAVTPGGVLDAASGAPAGASGEYISIYGEQFNDALTQAASLPLPTNLGNLSILIGGQLVPLNFAVPGQINAILPYGLTVGSLVPVVAIRGRALSTPVPFLLTGAAPGVFTISGDGTGQGHIYVNGTLANASVPAQKGDSIVIYCTGLGEVSPTVGAGIAVPTDAIRYTTQSVSVTIGGVPALVVFSGLTPLNAGLYQINATVPAGVTPGNAVPVIVSMGIQQSKPVTMAVK
jgi:uncharacterized protein (TIGR03437 family)